jgi:hypothetical protein
MQIAKRCPPSAPAHQTSETQAAVWAMIVILLGLASFAMLSLLGRVAG